MVYVLIVLLAVFLLTGCGIFHKPSPTEEVWKKLNVDSVHFKSCGPVALQKLHYHFGEQIDNRMASIDLQVHRKIKFFKLLGLINTKFRQITCPPELRAYLKRNGYAYEEVAYDSLTKNDFAIILLKGYDDIHEWHWATWPHDSESIPTFFSKYTKIVKTYKIYKKN